ncbi:MAG: T9SS type A sorting domain-containing protein [candidate division Zixibacteria bacterium]|nr:T9SS type A sorting domain-containing protein [candidate division Zixibacteria bacterium]
MKVKLLIAIFALVAFAAGASAQQDTLDQGEADSIFITLAHTPDVAAGDSSLVVEVYVFHDYALGGMSCGWQWTPEWMQLDTAYFSPTAVTAFNLLQAVYFPSDRAGSNANQTFQTSGLRMMGAGLLPSGGRTLVATYEFHIDSLFGTDEITFEYFSDVRMLFTSAASPATEWAPQFGGSISFFDPSDVNSTGTGELPTKFELNQNYPNPFNPVTVIKFDLPKKAHTTLTIFNVLGQRVTTLVDEDLAPNFYEIEWNGTTDAGNQVASGIYFYRLSAGENVTTKKMMLLK